MKVSSRLNSTRNILSADSSPLSELLAAWASDNKVSENLFLFQMNLIEFDLSTSKRVEVRFNRRIPHSSRRKQSLNNLKKQLFYLSISLKFCTKISTNSILQLIWPLFLDLIRKTRFRTSSQPSSRILYQAFENWEEILRDTFRKFRTFLASTHNALCRSFWENFRDKDRFLQLNSKFNLLTFFLRTRGSSIRTYFSWVIIFSHFQSSN